MENCYFQTFRRACKISIFLEQESSATLLTIFRTYLKVEAGLHLRADSQMTYTQEKALTLSPTLSPHWSNLCRRSTTTVQKQNTGLAVTNNQLYKTALFSLSNSVLHIDFRLLAIKQMILISIKTLKSDILDHSLVTCFPYINQH